MQKPKTMRFFFTSLFMVCFLFSGFTQVKREHFRGGMFPHIGYLYNDTDATSIGGFCSGIGGKLVFPVTDHIRVGTEGYVTSYNYKQNEGFFKLGWGGLLVEYQFERRKIMPVVGVTLGGGGIKDLYPVSGSYLDNEPDEVIYKKYSSLVIAPQVSLEYSLSSHINLAVKVDYLFYPGIDYPTYIARGPRFYFGILFSR
jgi:hypothetical protein